MSESIILRTDVGYWSRRDTEPSRMQLRSGKSFLLIPLASVCASIMSINIANWAMQFSARPADSSARLFGCTQRGDLEGINNTFIHANAGVAVTQQAYAVGRQSASFSRVIPEWLRHAGARFRVGLFQSASSLIKASSLVVSDMLCTSSAQLLSVWKANVGGKSCLV